MLSRGKIYIGAGLFAGGFISSIVNLCHLVSYHDFFIITNVKNWGCKWVVTNYSSYWGNHQTIICPDEDTVEAFETSANDYANKETNKEVLSNFVKYSTVCMMIGGLYGCYRSREANNIPILQENYSVNVHQDVINEAKSPESADEIVGPHADSRDFTINVLGKGEEKLYSPALFLSLKRINPKFLCPINREIMNDPVIYEGKTYEREAIQVRRPEAILIPDENLKNQIQVFLRRENKLAEHREKERALKAENPEGPLLELKRITYGTMR